MGEHTKLPWARRNQAVHDSSEHSVSVAYCGAVYGAGLCKDGEFRSFGITDDQAEANAAFIVEAVNNHDRLTRENEAMRKALKELLMVGDAHARREARAALSSQGRNSQ